MSEPGCGCRVESESGGYRSVPRHRIVYCPLHAAAERLAKTLDHLLSHTIEAGSPHGGTVWRRDDVYYGSWRWLHVDDLDAAEALLKELGCASPAPAPDPEVQP